MAIPPYRRCSWWEARGYEVSEKWRLKVFQLQRWLSYILSKCAKRIYCIWNLSKAGLPACDIVCIYCSVVRSVLGYACAVYHPGLSNKLSKDIERVQKRCLKIIYPNLSYSEALKKSGLVRLDSRREEITQSILLGKWNVLLIHCITCCHPARFPLLRWH